MTNLKLIQLFILTVLLSLFIVKEANGCSILFFKDPISGKVYVANNEDYWYDVKAYMRVMPGSNDSYARLWYGWDNFAQGGVNEYGLFFDGAANPKEHEVNGYYSPKGNIGDELLAKCKTAQEAVDFLESKKIALTDGHLLFGDKSGSAVVVEWINGERKLTYISSNYLMVTNFLLADPAKGAYPCPRYQAMEKELTLLKSENEAVDLKRVSRVVAKAVQVPHEDKDKRTFGTLYSTFINLTDMEFKIVYKLDNSKLTQLYLREVFKTKTQVDIQLK